MKQSQYRRYKRGPQDATRKENGTQHTNHRCEMQQNGSDSLHREINGFTDAWDRHSVCRKQSAIRKMNIQLTIGVLACFLLGSSSAIQCMTGIEGSASPVRTFEYPSTVFQCCYKYTDVVFQKFTFFGVVPTGLNKIACAQVGKCFFSPEIKKNVCVCANAEDPNCLPDKPIVINANPVTSNSVTTNNVITTATSAPK